MRGRPASGIRKMKHGQSGDKTPEYVAWKAMRRRCYQPRSPHFEDYGGRGIAVCEHWKDFLAFLADMGQRPSPRHSLDRFPDNNGNYEPGSCRWATSAEQGSNKRNNVMLSHQGLTMTLSEWARHLEMSQATLWDRLARGLPPERILTTTRERNRR